MDPLNKPSSLGQSPATGPSFFQLDKGLWQIMRQDVAQKAPAEEACGLLSGLIRPDYYQALQVHTITNQLHSPSRYDMAPEEVVEVFNQIEKESHELVGIYHSHINGPEDPSETDIALAYYPDCVYLIWTMGQNDWTCLGYLIQVGKVTQVPLIISQQRNH
jgi:proteasome lid subunit RPN8/RPN11